VGKVFVGNLSFKATEDDLKDAFGQVGTVTKVSIINDRETGRSRGFAFIEMENSDKAITQLNGKNILGRAIVVNQAQDKLRRDDRR
jgi:RNA recognition motif-containing protein